MELRSPHAIGGGSHAEALYTAGDPVLEIGPNFNTHIKSMVSGKTVTDTGINDTTVKAFAWSDNAPDSSNNAIDVSASKNGSVKAWIDSTSGTIYLYSTSQPVYLNSNSSYMFAGFTAAKTIDMQRFDSSLSTSMAGIFGNCKGLTSVDISKLDTSHVADMQYMFNLCSSLTSLDASKLRLF